MHFKMSAKTQILTSILILGQVHLSLQQFDLKTIALNCFKPGKTFKPDDDTICTCTGLLQAKCQPIKDSTTTTSQPDIPVAAPHPLDPLTANEISRSKEVILSTIPGDTEYIFNIVALHEPPKETLLPYFLSGSKIPRTAYQRKSHTVLIEKGARQIYEAVVNLDEGSLESWVKQREDFIPLLTPDDDTLADKIVRSDPKVKERCAEKGFLNMDLIYTATWPVGYIGNRMEYQDLKRPFQVFMYGLNYNDDNAYAHPMDFVVIVDIAVEKVIAIEDLPTHEEYDEGSNKQGNSVPRTESNYDYKLRSSDFLRKDDKPIVVTSPKGPSYVINGHEIKWQKFNMHVGFNPREGAYLNMISYNDSGTIRPILYRASLAEMSVYYADPRPPFHRKQGFDEGELGLGFRANVLKAQEDCLGETRFFSGIVNNNAGDPVEIKNAICIVEEDAGILWKHVNLRTGQSVVTRSHRLSIGMTATMGNYDYSLKWQFYQDASIQFHLQLTGILSTNMLAVDALPGIFGTRVFPQVNAQYHQHLFALRLDTEIDGNANSVYIADVVSAGETGSKENPFGNGFTKRKTYLKTQEEGKSKINPQTGRVWIVTNEDKMHPYTKMPVGWKLMPTNDPQRMLRAESPLHPKFEYLDYDIWITKYQEGQLFPGGYYLNNSGVPEWTATNPNESIYNNDIVLWHMFNPVHIPRAEDFPVMPAEERSVWFRPYNFFLENPALDVPPPSSRRAKGEL